MLWPLVEAFGVLSGLSFFSLAQPSKLDGKQAHQETSELDVRSASAFAVREEAGSCRTVTC
jgi:hypothetical protein